MRDLTAAELGIFLGDRTASDPTIYNCAELIEFEAPLDLALFALALNRVTSGIEALNTRFFEDRGVPRAAILPSPPEDPLRHRVRRVSLYSDTTGDATDDVSRHAVHAHGLREALQAHVREPFDLSAGVTSRHSLVVEGGAVRSWLFVAHHIVLDGFAFQLVARAVADEYAALSTGVDRAARVSTPLDAIAKLDAAYQVSTEHAEDGAYFAKSPVSHVPPARLTAYEVNGGHLDNIAVRPIRQQLMLGADTLGLLQAKARRLRTAWPEVALAATAHFVSAASGTQRFSLGVPVMLRLGTPKLQTPCMAMNIVRVPFSITARQSLDDTVRQLQSRWREQAPHHRFRYEELAGPRLGPVVNILPFTEPLCFGGVGSRSINLSAGPVTDVALMLVARGRELELTADGNPALFTSESLTRLVEHWVEVLHTLLVPDGVDAPQVAPLSLPVEAATVAKPDVLELWDAAAGVHPSALALISDERQLTHGELRDRVDRTARVLRQYLEHPLTGCAHLVVALELGRSVEAITLLLATLRVGACYAFIDPEQPRRRRRELVERLAPALLVTAAPRDWADLTDEFCVLAVGDVSSESENCEPVEPTSPDTTDPAYVVFTSGSTGAPKGVCISRGALAAFVNSALLAYPLEKRDRVLQFAPLTFDASVEEIFCTLCLGATLVLRTDAMLDSMAAFAKSCAKQRITVLDLPTAFWHEWVASMSGPHACPSGLRLVVIGGEAADPARLVTFRRNAPGVRLLNTYGPSEATVVATYADLTVNDLSNGVSIGRPLATVGAHVVDECGNVVVGAGEGELWLTGPQLASRYLGATSETASKFVALGAPPLRAYRTGDRVRRFESGELYFVGRIDHEIKLSGYRISPSEIEALLNSHEAVLASAVTADTRDGHKLLTAHVQLREPFKSLIRESDDALRRFLLARLPAPMVPTRYRFHDALPLNASGKLDRRALTETDLRAAIPTTDPLLTDPLFSLSPGSELLSIWRQVLGRPDAGPDDDFFRLGGHSLQVIQMASRLNALHPDLSVSAIFRNPTPRALLSFIRRTPDVVEPSFRDVAPLDLGTREEGKRFTRRRRSVLVTGATGFVGATLVSHLVTERFHTTCLVRAESDDAARTRLLAALSRHHCELTPEQLARLVVIACDLSEPLLVAPMVERLGEPDVVLHCAADVNLTRTFSSLFASNVTATRNLLRYAYSVDARFCYVSTLAVAPHSEAPVPELIFGAHEGLIDGYQQSKWHAEQLCSLAARAGLDVQVVRLGRVVGSARRPTLNPNDLVWRIARASTRCGCWPELAFAEVWTPVDTVASILTQLALLPREATSRSRPAVFHVSHQGLVRLARLRDRLTAAGYILAECPLPAWLAHVREHADAEDLATLAFFELAAQSPQLPEQASFDCTELRNALPELDMSPIMDTLIDRYVEEAAAREYLAPRRAD